MAHVFHLLVLRGDLSPQSEVQLTATCREVHDLLQPRVTENVSRRVHMPTVVNSVVFLLCST